MAPCPKLLSRLDFILKENTTLKCRLSCLKLKHRKFHNWKLTKEWVKWDCHKLKLKKVQVVLQKANLVKVKRIQAKKSSHKNNKCKTSKITLIKCKTNNKLNNKMIRINLWMSNKLKSKKLILKNKKKI